jgi:transposase InsO family protein
MTSKPVALLLADLGVTRSHSRPKVSNDNPYSESQFKTLKHHPTFPDRFGSLADARAFCQPFFGWYNQDTTIRGAVEPAGPGARIVWESSFEPLDPATEPELSRMWQQMLPVVLGNLKTLIEAG